MFTEMDSKYLNRNKEIFQYIKDGIGCRDIANMFNISETNVVYYSWLYKDHKNMYINNFIYKEFVDNKEVKIQRRILTKISHCLIRYFKDRESLIQAIKDRSVLEIKYIGNNTYERLKVVFNIEKDDINDKK